MGRGVRGGAQSNARSGSLREGAAVHRKSRRKMFSSMLVCAGGGAGPWRWGATLMTWLCGLLRDNLEKLGTSPPGLGMGNRMVS